MTFTINTHNKMEAKILRQPVPEQIAFCLHILHNSLQILESNFDDEKAGKVLSIGVRRGTDLADAIATAHQGSELESETTVYRAERYELWEK